MGEKKMFPMAFPGMKLKDAFKSAELFIDMGTHGWNIVLARMD